MDKHAIIIVLAIVIIALQVKTLYALGEPSLTKKKMRLLKGAKGCPRPYCDNPNDIRCQAFCCPEYCGGPAGTEDPRCKLYCSNATRG
jgi:hypothetical protein